MPKIYIALPVLDEYEYIRNFIQCLSNQTYTDFKLVVCVNQPDDWWEDPDKTDICIGNQKTIQYLSGITAFAVEIIDRSSKGNGWTGKQYGVGWARKTIMDEINLEAFNNDIIVSLDADTEFNPGYLKSIVETFTHNIDSTALAIPYYHKLTNDEHADRAILRYEIYMRYYAVNMLRIDNSYAFTAIGSAMAIPVKAYRAVGGITPHYSGEDFYFLQKLKKYGSILNWNDEWVYPAARFSDRVFFGTG
ncbi:MAG: glycosyltransferase, partial [Bacteroidales bacterium]|nr:glycosyltransferase [Bacteroidales bacterium]